MLLVNFSHPLNPAAEAAIRADYGAGELTIIAVPVQVDQAGPLVPQVERLVAQAVHEAGGNPLNIDAYIPPGLAPVAILVARALPHAHLLRLVGQGTPPVFMPAELISSPRRTSGRP